MTDHESTKGGFDEISAKIEGARYAEWNYGDPCGGTDFIEGARWQWQQCQEELKELELINLTLISCFESIGDEQLFPQGSKLSLGEMRKLASKISEKRGIDVSKLKAELEGASSILEAWMVFEDASIEKDGPYVGKKINELITMARSWLAERKKK